jgi:hypothetical protein
MGRGNLSSYWLANNLRHKSLLLEGYIARGNVRTDDGVTACSEWEFGPGRASVGRVCQTLGFDTLHFGGLAGRSKGTREN